jgi:hypothetical protein
MTSLHGLLHSPQGLLCQCQKHRQYLAVKMSAELREPKMFLNDIKITNYLSLNYWVYSIACHCFQRKLWKPSKSYDQIVEVIATPSANTC